MTALVTIPRLIAVTGYARSGKDTLAGLISNAHGHRIVHFADTLRAACIALDPIVGYRPTRRGMQAVRWAELLRQHGYEGAKAHRRWGPEFRRVMQRVGSDMGRDLLGRDLWVKATFATVTPNESIVIADMRFPDEMKAVMNAGGLTVRVQRPGVGPVNSHVSETALDGTVTDITIDNDKEPKAMLRQLERQVRALRGAA